MSPTKVVKFVDLLAAVPGLHRFRLKLRRRGRAAGGLHSEELALPAPVPKKGALLEPEPGKNVGIGREVPEPPCRTPTRPVPRAMQRSPAPAPIVPPRESRAEGAFAADAVELESGARERDLRRLGLI